jgi:hypothetical protein
MGCMFNRVGVRKKEDDEVTSEMIRKRDSVKDMGPWFININILREDRK